MTDKQKPGPVPKYGKPMYTRRVNASSEHFEKAERIGKTLSDGVRIALEAYEESDSAKDNQKAG
jgi:hypothetical protein